MPGTFAYLHQAMFPEPGRERQSASVLAGRQAQHPRSAMSISGQGRISLTFRIGATGHRDLPDPAALIPAIREALDGITERLFGNITDYRLVVVSALAEGADRLVAKEVLARPGAELEAALPRPPDDYLADFGTEESKGEFADLFRLASVVWQAAASRTREDGYQQAGHYIVDRSDAVIALWDGEPARGLGGTAAVVAYAQDQGVPLVWVPTTADPGSVTYRIDDQRLQDISKATREFRAYNAPAIPKFPLHVSEQRAGLEAGEPNGRQPGSFRQARENAAEWIIPYFVRADFLASRLERWFKAMSTAIFLLAAAAVTVVAAQAIFAAHKTVIVAAEAALLVVLLAATLVTRHRRVLDRWISYRFLAERLRSSYFLALTGTGDHGDQPGRAAYLSDPSEAWIRRALAEIAARQPDIHLGHPDLPALRAHLSHQWIGGQIRYHRHAASQQGAWENRLFLATGLLFAMTLVAAILHILNIGENSRQNAPWANLIAVAAICLPAIGAAVHGIRSQAQFRRHSQRHLRMASLLQRMKTDMDQAQSLARIREIAAETEHLMREENSDWFGVMRFHDVELIT
jgi:hypothetical protein